MSIADGISRWLMQARDTLVNKMQVNEAVRVLRNRLGLSQQAFANRFGMSLNAIARYEMGRKPAPIVALQMMHTALKEGHSDLAAVFASAGEGAELRAFGDALLGSISRNEPLKLNQRVSIGARLHSIWNYAGKPKPTKEDLAEIRRLASEAHELLEGMKIEDIPGDWKK